MYKLTLMVCLLFTLNLFGDTYSECELDVTAHSNIPMWLQSDSRENAKLLYKWIYLNSDDIYPINNELATLDIFKEKLDKHDYLYFKAQVFLSHKKVEEAKKLFVKSDNLGNQNAGYELFKLFNITSEKELAIKYLISSAEKGYSRSKFNLAGKYLKGAGLIKKDEKKAIRYFEESAMMGGYQSISRLNDDDVLALLSDRKKMLWKIIYNIYVSVESESSFLSLSQLTRENMDWNYFCGKFNQYRPSDGIDRILLDSKRYQFLQEIVQRCF